MASLSYLLGKHLVSLDQIGMVNIVAGKPVCPEFIQGAATPEALAHALNHLLDDTPKRSAMVEELRRVATALGPGGASERAAESVVQELATTLRPKQSDKKRKMKWSRITLAFLVPTLLHLVIRNPVVAAMAGLLLSPIAIVTAVVTAVWISCRGNAEEMAWSGFDAIIVLLLTAPLWVVLPILFAVGRTGKQPNP
jgi:hypothetical protein